MGSLCLCMIVAMSERDRVYKDLQCVTVMQCLEICFLRYESMCVSANVFV